MARGGTNPVWPADSKCTLLLPFICGVGAIATLTIAAYDEDTLKRDDFIGASDETCDFWVVLGFRAAIFKYGLHHGCLELSDQTFVSVPTQWCMLQYSRPLVAHHRKGRFAFTSATHMSYFTAPVCCCVQVQPALKMIFAKWDISTFTNASMQTLTRECTFGILPPQ